MSYWYDDVQIEYDALLLKQDKSDRDYRRMAEIETALLRQFGPEALDLIA